MSALANLSLLAVVQTWKHKITADCSRLHYGIDVVRVFSLLTMGMQIWQQIFAGMTTFNGPDHKQRGKGASRA